MLSPLSYVHRRLLSRCSSTSFCSYSILTFPAIDSNHQYTLLKSSMPTQKCCYFQTRSYVSGFFTVRQSPKQLHGRVCSLISRRQQYRDVSSIFSRLFKNNNVVTISSARSLFFNAKSRAEDLRWQSLGLVGSDFRSKQILLMVHVWIIHRRLVADGKKDSLLIQECMFDELWEDTSNRIRSHGINELSINKYLKEVQGYSFSTCVALDEGISKYKVVSHYINFI